MSAATSPETGADRFRVFRQRLLILLSTCVMVIGIALIIASHFATGNLHEDLVGVGAGVFATGPITVMVWWVTDDMYRGALNAMLRDVVTTGLAESRVALSESIRQSGAAIADVVRQSSSFASDCAELGLTRVHLTRVDALNEFSRHIQDEIRRAEHGEQARLWFVCASLRGFLDIQTNRFNPQALIRAAAAQPTLDLRILMADPEYTAARADERRDAEDLRQRSYGVITRLQREYDVPPECIRLYAFRPSVFAIATSRHMLLNPYPHEEQGSRCMSMVVTRLPDEHIGDGAGDIYRQYIRSHFERTWGADTTREVGKPPPLVSRISLSRDDTETNALLRREIAEHPPQAADLLEFSGDSVRQLLAQLAEAGTRVRLLLKHPDTVGRAQREKIISTYWYLKDHLAAENGDAFVVRFYRVHAALRGRRLDSRLLNVGWYTPDISVKGRISDWEIIGHLNPTVTGDPQTSEGYALNEMFGRTFDGLWGSAAEAAAIDQYLAADDQGGTGTRT